MDPTTVCCPNLACPARGPVGKGHITIHSRKDQRSMCTQCRKTVTATKGTACYRWRTSAETVTRVVTPMAHECPLQAIVVAFGVDERTVASGVARAGCHSQAVQEHVVEQPRDWGQVQADELRVNTPGGLVWMALAMMVRPRLWRADEVSTRRDLPLIRRLIERGRPWAVHRLLWVCTDGCVASVRAIREPCRDPERTGAHGRPRLRPWRNVGIAQVVQRHAQRRVVDVERRVIAGTPRRAETLRRRSHGAGVLHTASLERLKATFRERLAALTRRSRALARRLPTLQHGRYLLGTVATFCTPPASLDGAGRATTPAMAAGITHHCWTVRAWLSFHAPPPRWTPPKRRGRPAHARHHLVAPWCS